MGITPIGVGVLLIDPQGRVAAHGFDFERGGAAGFSLRDNQAQRARTSMSQAFIKAYCSYVITDVLIERATEIVYDLVRKGWTIQTIDIPDKGEVA